VKPANRNNFPLQLFVDVTWSMVVGSCTLGIKIKGLFEATTILHDKVHASVYTEKMKIFWLCSKHKFLSSAPYLNLLKTALTPQYNNA